MFYFPYFYYLCTDFVNFAYGELVKEQFAKNPKDATPGCTIEANNFNKHLDEFRQFDFIVLYISRDNVTSHKKCITAQCSAFPLLSDPDGEVCKKYGVWSEKNMFGKKYYGIQRSTFLIGKK